MRRYILRTTDAFLAQNCSRNCEDLVFLHGPRIAFPLGKAKQWGVTMRMAKSQDVPVANYLSGPANTKPVVLQPAEQMELEVLFEELAEFIESEDGILIP